jgi:hypothetical protein
MLTTEEKKKLKKYLEDLGNDVRGPADLGAGICYNIFHQLPRLLSCIEFGDFVDYYLVPLMQGWPKHSGDDHYPIFASEDADTVVKDAEDQYHFTDKWQGRQLELRQELCLYMASKL